MLSAGFIGRRAELHRIRRRLDRGDRVLVFQGLGGLGKTTLSREVIRRLAEPEAVCTFWCHELEGTDDPATGLVDKLLVFCRERFGPAWEQIVTAVDHQVRAGGVLHGAPSRSPVQSETFFARAALSAADNDTPWIRATTVTRDRLDPTRLDDYEVVALANVRSLTDAEVQAIEAYVAGGGGLLIAPGDKARS